MPWAGLPEQHEALWQALDQLVSRGKTDGALAAAIEKHRLSLTAQYPDLAGVTIDRTTIYRWRKDRKQFNSARFERRMLVYNFLEINPAYQTDFIKLRHTRTGQTFAGYCSTFYKVKRDTLENLCNTLSGIFQFYHYSQLIPEAIVIGTFEIERHDDGCIDIVEKQEYDGTLVHSMPIPMSDQFDGFGFRRNGAIYFMMRHAEAGIPKFYIFDDFHDERNGIPYLKGYTVKGSRDGACFRSPVFARRLKPGDTPLRSILSCNNPDLCGIVDILHQKELSMWYAKGHR